MEYPSIDKIKSICEPKLLNLSKEYRNKFNDEIRDLKKWQLFLQTDKAEEILKHQNENSSFNKSSSVILYLLNVTSVDPIQNNLTTIKKKFGKADPPDIDLDFHPSIRDDIKKFLLEKFGEEHVCSVGTVGTYKTKNVIQDVARALGLDIKEAIEVTKNLETDIGEGDEETKLDKASFDEICSFQPDLKNYFEKYENVRRHSEILRNQAKNYGTHAGGMIISNLDLLNKIPVFKDKEGRIVSAWAESGDHQELSSVGFVKFDLLGLCLEENTLIETNRGKVPIKDIQGLHINCFTENKSICSLPSNEYHLINTGLKSILKIDFDDCFIKCSYDHKFFKFDNEKIIIITAKELKPQDQLLCKNGYKTIKKVLKDGRSSCYDISLKTQKNLFLNEPNFILGNGIISHNCNLPIIDDCIQYIKENKGIEIKRSEIPIDDKESIRLGTKGDLYGIFQFENPYTKKLSDKVGVDCLGDIAAITSLIRPGPKDVGLDVEYALRKNGKKYTRNKIFDNVLGNTFGVLTYQEQCSLLGVHMAGMSPLKANALRKACAKKKVDLMAQLKPEFIQGAIEKCVKTGIMTQEQVEETWDMIESTASYSFNKCLGIDTIVELENKIYTPLNNLKIGDKIKAFSKGKNIFTEVIDIIHSGEKEIYKFYTITGNMITCTMDHKFGTIINGEIKVLPIREILKNNYCLMLNEKLYTYVYKHLYIGIKPTIDITINTPEHLFYANGLLTSNSHAVAYSAITTIELWLRHHFFNEYMTSLIQNTNPSTQKFGDTIFDKYIKYAMSGGVTVHKPDINLSGERFKLKGNELWFGLGHVKNVSSNAKHIENFQPYISMEDFYERCKIKVGKNEFERRPNSRVVESLIYAGAFNRFGSKEDMMKKYYELSGKCKKKKLRNQNSDIKSYIIPEIDDFNGDWTTKKKVVFVEKFENEPVIYELENPVKIEIEYENLPPLDKETLKEKEKELLGILFSENLSIKCRDIAKKYGVYNLRSAKHQEDKKYINVLGKIEKINEYTSKTGKNYLKVIITDGLWDYTFHVWSNSVNDFIFNYKEGDIAIIPLQNRGIDDENPNNRFFNSRGNCKIIERDGELQE